MKNKQNVSYDERTYRWMRPDLKELKEFLAPCRIDMHEPDEQEVSAKVVGDHLDNASGTYVNPEAKYQEFVVILNKNGKTMNVNLACLLALARMAVIPAAEKPYQGIGKSFGTIQMEELEKLRSK